MRRFQMISACIACAVITAGCATQGKQGVRVTQRASEVSNCTNVGQLKVPRGEYGDVNEDVAYRQFRQETEGLGGNAALVDIGRQGAISGATAYRCP